MFEDIFNDVADEKLYACEAALDIADYYGIDISACYEADGSEETAKKNFGAKIKAGVTTVVNKIKQFCTFIARKIKELFFKISKKSTFYMDPEVYKTNAIMQANADKIIALATKGINLGKNAKVGTKSEPLEAILAQIENVQKKNADIMEKRKDKSSTRYQVYSKPNCAPMTELLADADTLSKEADIYETFGSDLDPNAGGLGKINVIMPKLLRAKVAAINVKVSVANTFLAAPTSMPGKGTED